MWRGMLVALMPWWLSSCCHMRPPLPQSIGESWPSSLIHFLERWAQAGPLPVTPPASRSVPATRPLERRDAAVPTPLPSGSPAGRPARPSCSCVSQTMRWESPAGSRKSVEHQSVHWALLSETRNRGLSPGSSDRPFTGGQSPDEQAALRGAAARTALDRAPETHFLPAPGSPGHAP